MEFHVPRNRARSNGLFRPMRSWLVAIATMAAVAFDASAQCDPALAYHTAGEASAVEARGSYLYVGYPGEVRVYSVATPTNPTQVSSVTIPGLVVDLDIAGNYLFAALEEAGFAIVDISTPSNISLVSVTPPNDVDRGISRVSASMASGLLVAVDGLDMEIFDISVLTSPVDVATYNGLGFGADVSISGSTAYFMTNSGYLYSVDLTAPATPVTLDTYSSSIVSIFERLERSGTMLALGSWDGVDVVDASNPASISRFSVLPGDGIVEAMAFEQAAGQTLLHYDSDGDHVLTYDLTNPALPILRSTLASSSWLDQITAAGGAAYFLISGDVLSYDFSIPTVPALVHTLVPEYVARDVVVLGNYAIFATGAELRVVDVSTPTAPSAPVVVPVSSSIINRMKLVGTRLYIAGSIGATGILEVYNVLNPLAPVLMGSFPLPTQAKELDVRDQQAYVADSLSLNVIDVANPAAMALLGSFTLPPASSRWGDVFAWNGVVAEWDGSNSIGIYDATNPAAIAAASNISPRFSEYIYAFTMRDNIAYVAQSDYLVEVYDLSDPWNPAVVASFLDDTYIVGMSLVDSLLVISDGLDRVRFIDVADPTNPIFVSDAFVGGTFERSGRRLNTLWSTGAYGIDGIFAVTLPEAPRYFLQPQDQVACPSTTSLTLSVLLANPGAGGGATYQWMHGPVVLANNATYSGVTTGTLTINNPGLIQAGNYTCVATNACGSSTSAPAHVSLAVGILLAQQPQDAGVCPSGTATFDLTGAGTLPITYQWQSELPLGSGNYFNVVDGTFPRFAVSGAQGRVLTIGANPGQTLPGALATHYRCVASNACTAVTSAPALLSICPADLDDGSGTGTCDGGVDINDLLFFLAAFEAGAVSSDLDNGSGSGTPDGGVDINDLLFFLVRFENGC